METIIMNQDIINFLSKFPIYILEKIIVVGVLIIMLLSGFVIGYWFGQYVLVETLKDYYCTKLPVYIGVT
jgi:hypothetical protein